MMINSTKKINFVLILLLFSLVLFAQDGNGDRLTERIRARRAAFITERLDLTQDEAEKFFPLYNAYKSLERKAGSKRIPTNKMIYMSDEEAEKHIDQLIQSELAVSEARVQFIKDLRTVLHPKKILMLNQVERDFKAMLLKTINQRKRRRTMDN